MTDNIIGIPLEKEAPVWQSSPPPPEQQLAHLGSLGFVGDFEDYKIDEGFADLRKTIRETKGSSKKRFQDFDGAIRKVQTKIGQTSQKLKGEPVTKSGFTKGKDLKKVEKKANGGRIGRRFGSPKPKTSVDKIKETFSPKGTNLKPVDPKKQKGLSKLPKQVRNKMGYMKSGGRA